MVFWKKIKAANWNTELEGSLHVINSMMQFSSWEAHSSSVSQEIPPHFMEPEVSQQPVTCPILSQINPVDSLPTYFFKIYFNIVPSIPRSSTSTLSFTFTHQNPVCIFLLPQTWHILHSSNSPEFDVNSPNNIWWEVKIMSFLITWVASFYYRRNKKQDNPFRALTGSNMILF